jgi:hypothetical protein
MTVKKIILVSYVLGLGAVGVWYVSQTLLSTGLLGGNRWEVVAQQSVLRHPALANLWPHIRVEEAVVRGFQDKIFRFQFRFQNADRDSIIELMTTAGLKRTPRDSDAHIADMLAKKGDQPLPSWWSVNDGQPRCIWEAREAPAKPILSVIWSCDAGASDVALLGQITEF